MENVNYDVRDQFNQPLLNRAKLIEIIKSEREARERAVSRLREREEQIAKAVEQLEKGTLMSMSRQIMGYVERALAALRKE